MIRIQNMVKLLFINKVQDTVLDYKSCSLFYGLLYDKGIKQIGNLGTGMCMTHGKCLKIAAWGPAHTMRTGAW